MTINHHSSVMPLQYTKETYGLKEVGWKKEKSVFRGGSGTTCLLTKDIGPCLATAFWCPELQTASLIHTHPTSLNTNDILSEAYDTLFELDDNKGQDVKCYIRGGLGQTNESQNQYDMIKAFCKERHIALVEKGCLAGYHPTMAQKDNQSVLGISPENGTIYTGVEE